MGSAFPLNEASLDLVQMTAAQRAVTHRIHTCLDQYPCEGQVSEGSATIMIQNIDGNYGKKHFQLLESLLPSSGADFKLLSYHTNCLKSKLHTNSKQVLSLWLCCTSEDSFNLRLVVIRV